MYRADLITEELPTRLTLARSLESGPLEPATWRAVGRCIAALHARGVQHADLNAHNVLLGAGGQVYVLDFDRGRIRARGAWEEPRARAPAQVAREGHERSAGGAIGRRGVAAVARGCRRQVSALRILYLLLTYLLAPIVIAIEGWREIGHRAPRGRVKQRLGFVAPQAAPGCLWVHAVSVGEVQAAAALVRELRRRVPGLAIVLTTVTADGRAAGAGDLRPRAAALLPALRPAGIRTTISRPYRSSRR